MSRNHNRFEFELETRLQERGYVTTVKLSTRNDREGYILALRGTQRLVIRCRRYEERTDPEYINAAQRAATAGKIGPGYVLTYDGAKGTLHAYTAHVGPNRGNVASVAATILKMTHRA